MPNPSLLITPDEFSASAIPAEALPFDWTTVHQTVLKFVNPLLACEQTIAPAATSQHLLAAMQQLIAIIHTVEASPLAASKDALSESQRLEALLPYVSEEAYDVLDALCAERSSVAASSQQAVASDRHLLLSPLGIIPPLPNTCTTVESLIPSLLWHIARSAYSAMHLIEGIRVKRWQPEQGWASGMMRLVVMLEVEAPTIRWCFDLATGYPIESLLESTTIVQSDELALPIRCTTFDTSDASPCQVQHQLQAVLRQLQTTVPGLTTFLQGIPIELLQTGADWQAGELRLRFGFTFSAQASQTDSNEEAVKPSELIEAELMDEMGGLAQSIAPQWRTAENSTIAGRLAQTHVSVVNPTSRSLSPTTLVQLAKTEALEQYEQHSARQQLEQTLSQLHKQQEKLGAEESQLERIVQAAMNHCDSQPGKPVLELRHPMLLMDELVPKLLWAITSSAYEMMQLLGGMPAQVLQPRATWQQGTLRLLAALHFKAGDVDYWLDLSTGRSIDASAVSLDGGTIVQTNMAIGLQPTPIATIIDHLHQQLDQAMLEYQLLKDGVSIVWLEDIEQDWQSGTMKLNVSLAFVANAP